MGDWPPDGDIRAANAVSQAHIDNSEEKGFPFCDTCGYPAVFSEINGVQHSTDAYPFGLPEWMDTTGHRPSARGWWRDAQRPKVAAK